MPFEVPRLEALTTQPQVRELLKSVTPQNRAPSYLFAGPSGSGKTTHALGLVRRLFCAAGEGCSGCPACRQVLARTHPDLTWVDRAYVAEHTKEESKSLAINVSSMQALRNAQRSAPFTAPLRVAVVPQADLMSETAQDVLLKTLEEPAPRALMLLLAERPARLRPTILSRVRIVRFPPVESGLLQEALVASHGFVPEAAREAALWSGGDFREALRFADPAWGEFRDKVTADFDRALAGSTREWVETSLAYERLEWEFGEEGDEDLTDAQSRRKALQAVLRLVLSLWARRLNGTLPVPAPLKGLPAAGTVTALNRHLEALESNLPPKLVLDHLFLTLREGLKTGEVETRPFFDLAVL